MEFPKLMMTSTIGIDVRNRKASVVFHYFFLLFLLLLGFSSVPLVLSSEGDTGGRRYIIRDTASGPVRGFTETVMGQDVHIFLGIPYAVPPIGELRFRRPEPFPKWKDTRNATQLPASCYQFTDTDFDQFPGVAMWNANTKMSEDCLYLNVWQPSGHSPQTKKAVMVWIYGGAYNTGTSTLELYDARNLATAGDVVVVSMQYRVGPLGFLYLGRPEAPGNQGVLDQNLALRWVHQNIKYFNGDPERVTVFGESAGAHSANLQLLSPLSKNLLRSVILQSAATSDIWGVHTPEAAKSRAIDLARVVGCPTDPDQPLEVLKCFKGMDALKLSDGQLKIDVKLPVFLPFVPVMDGYFLEEYPRETLQNGKVNGKNILMGFNRDEGYYFLVYSHKNFFPLKDINKTPVTEKDYKDIVKAILPPSNAQLVVESVAFEYAAPYHFKTSSTYRKSLDDIFGDLIFKCPIADFALSTARHDLDVFVYQFNHRTSANPWPEWMGVLHGYEIDHVFGVPLNVSHNYTTEERELSREMIKYWSNFAKSGDPNTDGHDIVRTSVTWPKFKADERKVLHLDSTSIKVENGLRDRQCDFWRDIVPKLRDLTSGGSEISSSYFLLFLVTTLTSILLH